MEYLQVFDENKKALNEKVSRANKLNLPSGKYRPLTIKEVKIIYSLKK